MKIKICGLKSLYDIEIINKLQIDYAGIIFAQTSKRKLDFKIAKEMKKILNPKIKLAGVFVNSNIDEAAKISEILDIIQLHGNEDKEYINKLRNITQKEIIKAYKADKNIETNIKESNADYILIDSSTEKSFGGTGVTFDWNIIPETDKKIFLAGGLNSKNILKAIETVNPYCVDINSGVETDGNKDKNKVTEIVTLIREWEKNKKGEYNE